MSHNTPGYRDPYAAAYGAHDPYAASNETRAYPTSDSTPDPYDEYRRRYDAYYGNGALDYDTYYGAGSWERAQAAATAAAPS
ncbi:MAG: hypothetical protein ACKOYQ_07230, partial [Actinomycetota bacterium]